MKGGEGINTWTAVCLAVSVVAIVMSGYAIFADDSGSDYDQVRYTMYFGMGDRTDDEVQVVEDYVISEMERFGFGYNLERESGGYTADGQHMKDRVSLKFVTTDRDQDSIMEIIDNTKEKFGIEAAFLERDLVDSSFI